MGKLNHVGCRVCIHDADFECSMQLCFDDAVFWWLIRVAAEQVALRSRSARIGRPIGGKMLDELTWGGIIGITRISNTRCVSSEAFCDSAIPKPADASRVPCDLSFLIDPYSSSKVNYSQIKLRLTSLQKGTMSSPSLPHFELLSAFESGQFNDCTFRVGLDLENVTSSYRVRICQWRYWNYYPYYHCFLTLFHILFLHF